MLINYISKGLIRKIETMLGMSNKGGLKQGTDSKSKACWDKKWEGGITQRLECKAATTERTKGQRWQPELRGALMGTVGLCVCFWTSWCFCWKCEGYQSHGQSGVLLWEQPDHGSPGLPVTPARTDCRCCRCSRRGERNNGFSAPSFQTYFSVSHCVDLVGSPLAEFCGI